MCSEPFPTRSKENVASTITNIGVSKDDQKFIPKMSGLRPDTVFADLGEILNSKSHLTTLAVSFRTTQTHGAVHNRPEEHHGGQR
jgi:hypothetical protein